jgi:polyisoprenoid-binding protein YceI
MSTVVQQLPTGTYNIDPIHSSIGFNVKYSGLATFRSTFDDVSAQFADGVLTGTADVNSIQIDEPNFKGHVLAEDFFNAEVTPTIRFRSTEIVPGEGDSVVVGGELTIRGVTKPVTGTGTYSTGVGMNGAERIAFELETTVDRRDFGLNWQADLPNGAVALAWDVTLTVDLHLVKQD